MNLSTTPFRVPVLPPAAPKKDDAETTSRRRAGPRILVLGIIVLIVLGGAFAVTSASQKRREREVSALAATTAAAPPKVTVVAARHSKADAERILPGNAAPLLDASLFARVTGYVKSRSVDIGDRVQAGQVLAVIDAPDIDDQLNQAKANVEQAKANLKLNEANAALAKIVLARSLNINTKGGNYVSQEEIDQQRATVDTTTASVETARATIAVNQAMVQRFTDLQGFEKITAAFPGVITARHIDPGDLVSADSTSREMFHLMRTDILRVFVNVPQVYAKEIKVGQSAVVFRREDPLKQFEGKVTRTANALDTNTRTLLTEIQVPNPENALSPGMYLQVKFVSDRGVQSILIPSATLATRNGPPRVAILDGQNRVRYRTLQLGRDFGAEIEVLSGLNAGDQVVMHPGDDLPDGTVVDPVPPPVMSP